MFLVLQRTFNETEAVNPVLVTNCYSREGDRSGILNVDLCRVIEVEVLVQDCSQVVDGKSEACDEQCQPDDAKGTPGGRVRMAKSSQARARPELSGGGGDDAAKGGLSRRWPASTRGSHRGSVPASLRRCVVIVLFAVGLPTVIVANG